MICQECKNRQASVHLTKIINNQKAEIHLCDECARHRDEFINMTPFSVNDLLASFMDFGKVHPSYDRPGIIKCESCGLDYSQFKKMGQLGCQECYQYFKNELAPVLKKVQGRVEHTGKVPKRSGTVILLKKQINELKVQLKKAIDEEAFESAAELRDQLKKLEKQSAIEKGEQKGELDR